MASKIRTYDTINLLNGKPEIGRIVHLTFFSEEKRPNGPYHSFERVILRGKGIYVKDQTDLWSLIGDYINDLKAGKYLREWDEIRYDPKYDVMSLKFMDEIVGWSIEVEW